MTGKRLRFNQTQSLEERLTKEAKRLFAQADLLPPGVAREATLKKAQQAESAAHMSEWLTSPGLKPPV